MRKETNKRLLMCLLAACCGTFESTSEESRLHLGVEPGSPGATTLLPATLAGGTNVVALQFDVAFNGSRASLQGVLRGTRLTNHVLRSREISPNRWRVLVYSATNATLLRTNLDVASLPFTIAANELVGSGPLTPTNNMLARADASQLTPVLARPGAVFVRQVNRRDDGIVDFFLPSTPDQRYVIQATTNFIRWDTIATNVASGNFMALVDLDGPKYPYRFYRWVLYDAAGELHSVEALPNGITSFGVSALDGRTYRVEASTNLVSWQVISTQTATAGRINFNDPDAIHHRWRFYRLSSGP